MLIGFADGPLGLTQDRFGFSITHLVKKVGHGVATVGKKVGHGAVAVGKETGHLAVKGLKLAALPAVELERHVLAPALRFVLTPVRHKVDTLKDRRAKKLAADRGHPGAPTLQDKNDARAWAKSYLKKEVPPFGLMLSLLAGAPPATTFQGFGSPVGGQFGDPATATIIASVPTLLVIIEKILTRSSNSGDAPANSPGGGGTAAPTTPDAGGGADAAAAGGDAAAPDAGGDAGAGADAGAGGNDGGGGGGGGAAAGGKRHGKGKGGSGGGGGGGKMLTLPGIGPVPKNAVYIGGGVLALILIVAIAKK